MRMHCSINEKTFWVGMPAHLEDILPFKKVIVWFFKGLAVGIVCGYITR